jgi:hypothetical protein
MRMIRQQPLRAEYERQIAESDRKLKELEAAKQVSETFELSPRNRWARFHQEYFTFSPAQGKVVSVLWEAYQKGAPDMPHRLIIEQADPGGNKLQELFKRNRALGTLIVKARDKWGHYRLSLP